ncbi:translocon-associated protein subunit alpha, partial [Tanacetum coccineum]
ARSQSDPDSDNAELVAETVEEGGAGNVGDEAQDFGVGNYNSAPGVETVCVFPKNIGKLVVAGQETEVLIGLKNEGEQNVKVLAIHSSVHLPYDHRMLVQNLSTVAFNKASVPASVQATFPYVFAVSKFLQPGTFDLVGTIVYEIDQVPYQNTFYNGTIEVTEAGGLVSVETVFLVSLGLASLVLFGLWVRTKLQVLSKKTKKITKIEVGTRTVDASMDEWLQLLRNSGGDSGPDLSFDKSASRDCLFSSALAPFSFLPTFSIMAKKDMNLYHSRLTPDDLNDLIIKYKIPRDLHHRLPSEDFVMSELPDDAIGPLGLNKVITFEVLCRSLQIEPTVNLFRVFQTLFKQGGLLRMLWFGEIRTQRSAAGSFNMADVRRLSAHVIKLRDMPEGVLVLSGLSRVWKSRVCDPVLRGVDGNVMGIHDFLCLPEWTGAEVQEEPHLDVRPTLQRLPFYCTPSAAADVVIPDPNPEDLAVGTPSSKIVSKAEASQKRKASTSQKRKASTSGATSSHVAKCTRPALAQSSGSTTRPSLFVGDDDESDDDDACVEILLITPLRSASMIPSLGNQSGSSVAPSAEGSNTRDYRSKGVMVDDAAAPFTGVSRPRPSSGPALSFRDVSGDAIHTDFFPFFGGPYYATYPEDGVAGNCEFIREEWDAPY